MRSIARELPPPFPEIHAIYQLKGSMVTRIGRPVRYGWGHSPHEEDGVVFEDPHDPLGFWDDINEILDQWKQSAAPDLTPKADG